MVLEATVIILDNSEWMRNGDYIPSRMDVQQDAAQLLCNAKRQSNVENSVAIMTMAGTSPKVLVTLTSEHGKLQHAVASCKFAGDQSVNLPSSLQVAQLILKNRQNNKQRQRIVVFVGSPLVNGTGTGGDAKETMEKMAATGKALRKNGVSIDVISFGHCEDNAPFLYPLLAANAGVELTASSNIYELLLDPNCETHLLEVRPGDNLNEALMNSLILLGSDGSASAAAHFGMDEDMDPELAMALKLSMEEEKSRQEKEKQNAPNDSSSGPTENGVGMAIDDDEDAMLARAIAMSMEQEQKKD